MEGWATIIAALLGAGIGSLGAQALGEMNRRQQVREATKRDVAVNHLMQLQDALESLWFRLTRTESDEARDRAANYYDQSSLYVLAIALAQMRLLVVKGAYAALDVFDKDLEDRAEVRPAPWWKRIWARSGDEVETKPKGVFPQRLEDALDKVEKELGKPLKDDEGNDVNFYRYQRRALADLIVKWESGWRVLNYAEFMQVVSDEGSKPLTDPAAAFLARLKREGERAIKNDRPRERQEAIASEIGGALAVIVKGTKVALPKDIRDAIGGGESAADSATQGSESTTSSTATS